MSAKLIIPDNAQDGNTFFEAKYFRLSDFDFGAKVEQIWISFKIRRLELVEYFLTNSNNAFRY